MKALQHIAQMICKMRGMRYAVLVLLMGLLLTEKGNAQDLEPGWKHWSVTTFSIRPTKKLSLKVGGMYSFNPAPFRLSFAQTTLGASYRLSYKYYVAGGYNTTIFRKPNQGRQIFNRFYGQVYRKDKLFGFKIKNTFKLQYYLPRVQKYLVRAVYQFKFYFNNKILPMKLTPYIAHDLMWYIGGKPVIYYDEFDEISAFQSPSGMHRYRLSLGLSFKPVKPITIGLFYKRQWEFNTNLFPNRGLNITRTNTSDVVLPFNYYWAWGWSISYSLRFY